MAGEVTREELNALIKGINGDFEDIKVSLRDLNSTMNRRFDTLDAKMETERKEGLESHRRIHKRIDEVEKGHVSKATTTVWVLLTGLALSGITAFVTLLLAR